MLVLVYVDDILVETKDEEQKKKLFEDLDKEYGLKEASGTVSGCGSGADC
ncbi:hypothetical protein PF010_g30820 [Phytophthora fragariae]|nr:hypothetical protein PF009_g31713 [Phytophthora fragariae]KAE8957931.1 hypothetical protein PF011_g30965 [Phytophthora fragariae]KAE9054422.1 hypothetical protein PF006_g33260 [Phytophthora fragariae]KAE9058926.1 hypothetical protein PF010_g30820 [Phytophthora fragariae]KAE9164522.1 hypothetical protein PF004_g29797 [Phytophthora fragariae]